MTEPHPFHFCRSRSRKRMQSDSEVFRPQDGVASSATTPKSWVAKDFRRRDPFSFPLLRLLTPPPLTRLAGLLLRTRIAAATHSNLGSHPRHGSPASEFGFAHAAARGTEACLRPPPPSRPGDFQMFVDSVVRREDTGRERERERATKRGEGNYLSLSFLHPRPPPVHPPCSNSSLPAKKFFHIVDIQEDPPPNAQPAFRRPFFSCWTKCDEPWPPPPLQETLPHFWLFVVSSFRVQ